MLPSSSTHRTKGGPVSDSLSFKYTLTKGDAVGALRAQALRSRFLWVAVAWFALMAGYSFYNDLARVLLGQGSLLSLLRTVLTFGGLGVAWWGLHWLMPYWTAQRWPEVGIEKEMTVSENGIAWKSALENRELTWANYTNAVETDDFFLLYMGRANFEPIPKRQFDDSSLAARIRELIRFHIPDTKLLDRASAKSYLKTATGPEPPDIR